MVVVPDQDGGEIPSIVAQGRDELDHARIIFKKGLCCFSFFQSTRAKVCKNIA